MQPEETFPSPSPAPARARVPRPGHPADAGTPIYDALVHSWKEQGRQLPRPRPRPGNGFPGGTHQEPLRSQTGTWVGMRVGTRVRTSNWQPGTAAPDHSP
ncbi:hypothetical protein [Streptomyces sp. NPDC054863]